MSDISNVEKRVFLDKLVCMEPNTSENFVNAISLIIPEFKDMMGFDQKNPWHLYTLGEHTIEVMKNVDATPEMRLAALLHDIGKLDTFSIDSEGVGHFYKHSSFSAERAIDILNSLEYEEDFVKNVTILVRDHDRDFELDKTVKKYLDRHSPELFDKLMSLETADALAQNPEFTPARFERINFAKEAKERIQNQPERLTVKDLAINGKYLMENYGLAGKEIGSTLNKLVEDVTKNPELNTKEKLSELLDERFKKKPEVKKSPEPEPGSSGMS